jgi:hypothetical protein
VSSGTYQLQAATQGIPSLTFNRFAPSAEVDWTPSLLP